MKISRNGQSFELTALEMRLIYEEQEKNYRIDDFRSIFDVPNDKINQFLIMFDKALTNNEGYWEDYWSTMENVGKELGLKEKERN